MESQQGLDLLPLRLLAFVREVPVCADKPCVDWRREPRDEVDTLVLGPARRVAVTGNRRRALDRQLGVDCLIPVDGKPQIEHERRGPRRDVPAKGVLVDAHAPGGRHFGADVVGGQLDRVVAWSRAFLVVGKRQSQIAGHRRAGQQRRHEEIAQVSDPGAAQVRVAEAGNLGVGVVVSRAPVPPLLAGIRAELHHSERHDGTRKRMSMPACPDEWVDEPGQFLARLLGPACRFLVLWPPVGGRPYGQQGSGRARAFDQVSSGNHGVLTSYFSVTGAHPARTDVECADFSSRPRAKGAAEPGRRRIGSSSTWRTPTTN